MTLRVYMIVDARGSTGEAELPLHELMYRIYAQKCNTFTNQAYT